MNKGTRLKKLRESKNLGQTEAARLVGVSKQTLYKYENDIITNIPSDIIERLAVLYETSPCYIMGWVEKRSNLSLTYEEANVIRAYRSTDETTKGNICLILGVDRGTSVSGNTG